MNDQFEAYRPLLFSIAYRMLGSAMEAEDIVQEAYLRYQTTPKETIRAIKPFLTTIVTRLCLDQLKSARMQRETYVGPWLPEPVSTEGDSAALFSTSPTGRINAYESISMAFLVLLESLSPSERAVFLLREVFDYDYGEIATIVGKGEAACRQLFSRAKKHIAENKPRFDTSPQIHRAMIENFMTAIQTGDLSGLMALLAEDVTLWSDGGGVVTAARRPVRGADAVARFLFGIARFAPPDAHVEIAEVNGAPSLVMRYDDGRTIGVMNFEVVDRRIAAIRVVMNPHKLRKIS
ncbi:MAG: RNA polymerase sigma-70 factor [Chloroflexi bacterium]|nr:MAG: RNA polymerase sigma-70 factor [Chloroflexota bacterium]